MKNSKPEQFLKKQTLQKYLLVPIKSKKSDATYSNKKVET